MTIKDTRDQWKPIHYQREDVQDLYRYVRAGESCSLVGIGSGGKSNLLSHLRRQDVKSQPEILGKDAPYCVMVLLNPHKLVHLHGDAVEMAGACWPGYEIMLSRLRRALWELNCEFKMFPPDEDGLSLVDRVQNYYGNLFNTHVLLSQAGIRHLEDAIYEVLFPDERWKIIFMFDEIEAFFNRLPPEFFQSMRGVRDEFKQRVAFIAASRRPLDELVSAQVQKHDSPDLQFKLEGFVELFHEATHYIRPLDWPSAEDSVNRYFIRNNLRLSPDDQFNLALGLFKIAGGHAGLLRRCFRPLLDIRLNKGIGNPHSESYPPVELLAELLQDDGIAGECRIIVDSLPSGEKRTLQEISSGQRPVNVRALKSLVRKRLVHETQNRLTFPILMQYVLTHMLPDAPPR